MRRSLALVVPLLVLLLAGCGGPEGITGPAAVKLPVSKQLLLVGGSFRGGAGQTMEGKAKFVNGCLGFTSAGTDYVAVWPTGSKITSDTDDTVIANGHSLTQDATITMSVDVVHAPYPKQFPQIPLYCTESQASPVAWVHRVTKVQE